MVSKKLSFNDAYDIKLVYNSFLPSFSRNTFCVRIRHRNAIMTWSDQTFANREEKYFQYRTWLGQFFANKRPQSGPKSLTVRDWQLCFICSDIVSPGASRDDSFFKCNCPNRRLGLSLYIGCQFDDTDLNMQLCKTLFQHPKIFLDKRRAFVQSATYREF